MLARLGAAISSGIASLLMVAAGSAVAAPVSVAKTTRIPACTVFVDTRTAGTGAGTVSNPYRRIASAVASAAEGAIICVAEGAYPERIVAGTRGFTLAGGFQTGKAFKVRNSATYVSLARGRGGSFVAVGDPAPTGRQLIAIDGFEITGYSQAIVRDYWESQRFDVTNNNIHDNTCAMDGLAGAGFALNNVTGSIRGNVFRNNACWRGGAGFLNDSVNGNRVTIANNRFVGNAGTEPGASHGGALYLFTKSLVIKGNAFLDNTVTAWGGGLYVGAFTGGGQTTTARLSWNVYRGNKADNSGGGFFCDDSAVCIVDHEIFDGNCGGNILVDGGPGGSGPTIARFDHMTNINAREVGCATPGYGLIVTKGNGAADRYTVTNSIFSGNARNGDLATFCDAGCASVQLSVSWSMIQRGFFNGGFAPRFGTGILAPADPRFVNPAKGDLHLKSTFGHYTRTGIVRDAVSSPALARGNPASPTPDNPVCAGPRTELGAYGNSAEASCVR